MGLASERRRYIVTSSLICWAHTHRMISGFVLRAISFCIDHTHDVKTPLCSWASCHLESAATRMFVLPPIQNNNKEHIKRNDNITTTNQNNTDVYLIGYDYISLTTESKMITWVTDALASWGEAAETLFTGPLWVNPSVTHHIGPVMRKAFPFYDVIATPSWLYALWQEFEPLSSEWIIPLPRENTSTSDG